MESKDFKSTKIKFKENITYILENERYTPGIAEAAFPAYAHKNSIIDYIFWRRIKIVYNFICSKKLNEVLDFGCGSGIMSFLLGNKGLKVTAIDLDLEPFRLLEKRINFPQSIEFIEGDLLEEKLMKKSFDAVIALDVLEHIPQTHLSRYLNYFVDVLSPDGFIVISLPTENIIYKIGRAIAGKNFEGTIIKIL